MARHYGMDWLRIGAFALLILYHIGMVFVPWNFHVKSVHVEQWATVPMLATNAWRLSLLFVVSGYASRALLRRSSGTAGFFRNRSYRLLVPLAFGVAVVVPPQPWVELVTKRGYAGGYWPFWTHDFFSFGTLGGIGLPTWNHLWFVGYLWIYTALLALGTVTIRLPALQRGFDRLFGTAAVLWLPIGYLVCVHARWFPMVGETHALLDDWIAHITYFPAFLFGFGLARSEPAMAAIGRWWPLAAGLALLGYGFIAAVELGWPATPTPRWVYGYYGAAHATQQWAGIVALIGIAERWWNRDHRWRPMLTEAIFPFYMIHQTVIVVVMWALLPAALPAAAEFAILVASTVAGCWLFYLVGRAIRPLRPLIGLRGDAPAKRAANTPSTI
ncbi:MULTISPECIES: acyltransferase [unclassified Sphingomonas]|uniref:acyltransferase family protein n=1 Tax=unclassified Sphingomonas TaxID=196159 RepID=UPI0022699195|nr:MULTISPECIES: acyltransferase [unclassified Sphingomonas]